MSERHFIYLFKPGSSMIATLNGVREDTVKIERKLKDYGSITFDVDKYVSIEGKFVKSNGYESLRNGMEIAFDDKFRFKLQEPEIHDDGYREYKTITAYSLEKELEFTKINSIQVHTGTTGSIETLATVNKDKSFVASDFKWVTFWNEDKELSLINVLLNYAPGWKVGHVDDTIKVKEISLDVEDRNLYGLLTSEIAYKARCVFLFDSYNRVVNVYDIETFGEDLDIYLSYRNLVSTVDVTCESDNIMGINLCTKAILNIQRIDIASIRNLVEGILGIALTII